MILLAIRRLRRLLARLTGGSLAVLGNPPRRSLRSPHNPTARFARPTLSKLAPLAFTPTLVPPLLAVRSKTAVWYASEVGFEVAASNGLGSH